MILDVSRPALPKFGRACIFHVQRFAFWLLESQSTWSIGRATGRIGGEDEAIRLTGALTFIMEKVYDCKAAIGFLLLNAKGLHASTCVPTAAFSTMSKIPLVRFWQVRFSFVRGPFQDVSGFLLNRCPSKTMGKD